MNVIKRRNVFNMFIDRLNKDLYQRVMTTHTRKISRMLSRATNVNVIKINKFIFFIIFKRLFNKGNILYYLIKENIFSVFL